MFSLVERAEKASLSPHAWPRGLGTDLNFDEVETLRVMSQVRVGIPRDLPGSPWVSLAKWSNFDDYNGDRHLQRDFGVRYMRYMHINLSGMTFVVCLSTDRVEVPLSAWIIFWLVFFIVGLH
jgi:hypothetical protein